MAGELDNAIKKNAQGPKRATGDSGSVEQHDLKDQIEADRYLSSREAARRQKRRQKRCQEDFLDLASGSGGIWAWDGRHASRSRVLRITS